MYNELSWDEVTRRSGYPVPLSESTTVTKRIRRVGEFDWDLAARAVKINRPTRLALHGADYISYDDLGVRTWSELSRATRSFVTDVEHRLGVPVDFVFTGPDEDNIVDRRGGYQTVEATVTEPDDKKSSQVV
jgi:adenylosuccinate synthase